MMISKWLTAQVIAGILGKDKRIVNRMAVDGKWHFRNETGRGGTHKIFKVAALPEDIQAAYSASLGLTLEDMRKQLNPSSGHRKKVNIMGYNGRGAKTKEVKTLEDTPDDMLRIASLRKQLIDVYSASGLSACNFITAYENGVAVPELREQLGRWGNIHTPSNFYKNWLRAYEEHGLAGLAPQYATRRGGSGASLDDRAKEIIEALFLDPRKPSMKAVWRDVEQFGYTPCYSKVERYIKDEIPDVRKILYREGPTAFHNKCEPYIERDYTLYKPMEWVCGDHHNFDFVINYNGKICRPWLTAWIDMRSRKILGWWIDLVPNTLTVIRSFAMLVDAGGLPGNALIDNGKDYKSSWFAGTSWKEQRTKIDKEYLLMADGILQDCGTNAHFATPYRGQSKPIERFFRTVIETFSKAQDFYTGSNTVDAPEDKQLYWKRINGRDRIEVTYTLEQLRDDFANYVTWFNTAWHHSGDGMDSKTPDDVFYANLEGKREMPLEMRKYVFAVREKRVVQRNGVTLDGINYYNTELVRLIGERVEVRRDINDIGKVSIFTLPDAVYQFDAESELFKDKGLREEQIRQARALTKQVRQNAKTQIPDAEAIRQAKKTPAELLAETTFAKPTFPYQSPMEIPIEMRKVVGGEPLVSMPQKRRLIGLLDSFEPQEAMYAQV
jgi:transposase InsO family protein